VKREYDPVVLRRNFWHAPEPKHGDGLITKTGRRYLIIKVKNKRLYCLVLPNDDPIDGTIFEWTWSARTRALRNTVTGRSSRGIIRHA
jgi:hypothetical protein